jgi:adenine-specific DNA-methyltransferase
LFGFAVFSTKHSGARADFGTFIECHHGQRDGSISSLLKRVACRLGLHDVKYMGSKRAMLENGLGALLARELKSARRFVDLFAGSAAVAVHVAQRHAVPVFAYDLQEFSAVLAAAIVERQEPIAASAHWPSWFEKARSYAHRVSPPRSDRITTEAVSRLREWCGRHREYPVTYAYGGHYFSPAQAVWIDALRATIPKAAPVKTAALAALVHAASLCAAAPGHTAQPFQPTRTGKAYIKHLWGKDIVKRTKQAFELIAVKFAQVRGAASVGDANEVAKGLREGDLVFVDPPYSAVQYSRFYHVFETITRGGLVEVSGRGRYPDLCYRPQSKYCKVQHSAETIDGLLEVAAQRRVRVILTFPNHECSNGLSGVKIRLAARRHFRLRSQLIKSRFSTLGGTGSKGTDEASRAARQDTHELMLVLEPK